MGGHCHGRARRDRRGAVRPGTPRRAVRRRLVRFAFVESESDRAARIARDREAQRAQPLPLRRLRRRARARRAAASDSPSRRRRPPATLRDSAAPAAWRAALLDRLPRPEPRRPLSGAADPDQLAGRRAEADLEAAGRRRLRVVRHRRRPRLHHRAARAAGNRRGLRRRHRPRAVDQRVDRGVPRVDGRRPARARRRSGTRARVRARRPRRVAVPRRRDRRARVAHEHPRGQRRDESAMGHVRGAARRRRHRHRPARRTGRTGNRSSPTIGAPGSARGRRWTISRRMRRRCW